MDRKSAKCNLQLPPATMLLGLQQQKKLWKTLQQEQQQEEQ